MKRWALLIGAALILMAPGRAEAATIVLDTTPLQALGGTWHLDFQLIDGDGAVNNTVGINILDLGGGTAGGGESFFGDASGTFPTYALADTDFFNQVLVPFTAGSQVLLELTFTENFAGGFADTFSWAVLDETFASIVTDPFSLGAGLVILLDGSSPIQRVAADPAYNSIIPEIQQATVPEPATGALLALGLAGRWALRRRTATSRSPK